MKTYSVAAQAALAAGAVMTSSAVRIGATTPFLVWGGEGDLVLNSETYIGIGDAGLVSVTGSQIGGTEDSISLTLSGVDPAAAAAISAPGISNAPVIIWRLLFDATGHTLLDATIFEQGRLDKLTGVDTPGGTSTITATVETAARGLGRRTGRMTSDADQRLISATDGSCSMVTQAGQLTFAWGGKPPARAGLALPGGQMVGNGYGSGIGAGLANLR